MIKINFNEVEIFAPNGENVKVKDYAIIAATFLWKTAPTIPLYKAALILHDGDSAEVNEEDLKILLQIFLPDNNWILPFAAFPMISYLQGKIPNESEKIANES